MTSRSQAVNAALAIRSDADVVTRLREGMPEALAQLDAIACGNVPRNAGSILKGIELLLRFSQPLPKQVVDVQGSVGIVVLDPFAAALAVPTQAVDVTNAQAVKALPPLVRRKQPPPTPAPGDRPGARGDLSSDVFSTGKSS